MAINDYYLLITHFRSGKKHSMLGNMKSGRSGNGIKVLHRQIMYFVGIEVNGDLVQITKFALNEVEEFTLCIKLYQIKLTTLINECIPILIIICLYSFTYFLLEKRTAHNQRLPSFR